MSALGLFHHLCFSHLLVMETDKLCVREKLCDSQLGHMSRGVPLNLTNQLEHGGHLGLLHVLPAPLQQVVHVNLLVGVDDNDCGDPLVGKAVSETDHRAVGDVGAGEQLLLYGPTRDLGMLRCSNMANCSVTEG